MKYRYFKVMAPAEEYTKFSNKCKFFDTTPNDILTELIIKFNRGELDTMLGVPDISQLKLDTLSEISKVILNGTRK